MPQVLNNKRCSQITTVILFGMWVLLCHLVISSRFFQGFAMRKPEKDGLSTMLNWVMRLLVTVDDKGSHAIETTADVLSIMDGINQGALYLLSELIKYHDPYAEKFENTSSVNLRALFCLLVTFLLNASTAFNGVSDFMSTENEAKIAVSVGVAIAVLASPSAAWYTYMRAVKVDREQSYDHISAWPKNCRNLIYFIANLVIGNIIGSFMNFYQFYRSLNLMTPDPLTSILAGIFTLASLFSSNYVQMRLWGRRIAMEEIRMLRANSLDTPLLTTDAETALVPATKQKELSFSYYHLPQNNKCLGFFTIATLLFLQAMNWFNVISAIAMFNIVMAEIIPGYKDVQSRLYVAIPIAALAMYGGYVNAKMIAEFRITPIKEFCRRAIWRDVTVPFQREATIAPADASLVSVN